MCYVFFNRKLFLDINVRVLSFSKVSRMYWNVRLTMQVLNVAIIPWSSGWIRDVMFRGIVYKCVYEFKQNLLLLLKFLDPDRDIGHRSCVDVSVVMQFWTAPQIAGLSRQRVLWLPTEFDIRGTHPYPLVNLLPDHEAVVKNSRFT